MVIAERTTSYGFLTALPGVKSMAIAQQSVIDIWPEKSVLLPLKKIIQHYAFEKADLIYPWGTVITIPLKAVNVDMRKVMVLPKRIDLLKFSSKNIVDSSKISAIVTDH